MSLKKNLATFAFVSLLSPAVLGAVVLKPIGVESEMDARGGFPLQALIDQSGLNPMYDESGKTDYKTYVESKPQHSSPASNSWVSSVKPVGFIDFELPEPFVLTDIALWSGSALSGFGSLFEFNILIGKIPVGSFKAINGATAGNPISMQTFILEPALASSFVRLEVVSNYGNEALTVISEVAFGGTPITIPEPTTAVLLGLGLASLGFRKYQLH